MSRQIEVTEKFYGRPLLVDETFASYLNQKYGTQLTFDVPDEGAFSFVTAQQLALPATDGLAHIPVSGTLMNGVEFGVTGWFTGYDYITQAIRTAEANDTVHGIVLHVSSHGGEVAGCFECAEVIRSAQKPTLAVVESYAHSAAYALSSAADTITLPRTGSVGSIGVVTLHVDYSEALEEAGVKPTFIFAGAHKVDGNPYEPLSKSVKADIQARIDDLYDVFVDAVATNRDIDAQAVRDTEARTYGAAAAVELGLADAVATPADAVAAFFDELVGSFNSSGGISMSNHQDGADATHAAPEVDVDAIAAEARSAERERISAILTCEEAANCGDLANHLAFETDQSAESAIALMAKAPKPAAEAPAATFADVMNSSDHPNVGADGEEESEEMSAVDTMFAAFDSATGRKAH